MSEGIARGGIFPCQVPFIHWKFDGRRHLTRSKNLWKDSFVALLEIAQLCQVASGSVDELLMGGLREVQYSFNSRTELL